MPNNQVRGQLDARPVRFAAFLNSAQQVPASASPAKGTGTFDIDQAFDEVDYSVTWNGGAGTSADLHLGPPGVPGVIYFPLLGGPSTWSFFIFFIADVNYDDFQKSALYVDIHSAAFPAGAIRGQVIPTGIPYGKTAHVPMGLEITGAPASGSTISIALSNGNPSGLALVFVGLGPRSSLAKGVPFLLDPASLITSVLLPLDPFCGLTLSTAVPNLSASFDLYSRPSPRPAARSKPRMVCACRWWTCPSEAGPGSSDADLTVAPADETRVWRYAHTDPEGLHAAARAAVERTPDKGAPVTKTGFVTLFTFALLTFGAVAESRAQTPGLYFLGAHYGTTNPADPSYDETKLDIFYPAGGLPKIWGWNSPVMPVAVLVHGGNTNSPASNPPVLSALPLELLANGFVVVIPSFHVLDLEAGEEFVNATKDIARVIQFLRRYHTIINIDPARVFAQGHSGGGYQSLFLGLNIDFQDLASPDLVLHESSRPDFVVPWGSPTDWSCFDFAHAANNYFSKFFFGESDPVNIGEQEKVDKSPTYWLAHPELFGRTTTPPMCLVYNLNSQSACGAIIDVHDGTMGVLLMEGIESLCLGSGAGQAFCTESVLLGTSHGQGIPNLVAWMTEKAF